jgi:hypothetical protein
MSVFMVLWLNLREGGKKVRAEREEFRAESGGRVEEEWTESGGTADED